mgnify:CR=1 FL=1
MSSRCSSCLHCFWERRKTTRKHPKNNPASRWRKLKGLKVRERENDTATMFLTRSSLATEKHLLEEEEKEEDLCRVCRCGSTPEQPLFYPCLCKGSIRYIHQDCLLEWLQHSKKTSCELCKHSFKFRPSTHIPFNHFFTHVNCLSICRKYTWAVAKTRGFGRGSDSRFKIACKLRTIASDLRGLVLLCACRHELDMAILL